MLTGAAPLVLAITLPSGGASGAPAVTPQVIRDSSLSAIFTTSGGATPLATDRTVAHFATSTLDGGFKPNGTLSADGTYHPEDEVFLPWFMRLAPNTVSALTQSTSTNVGRYALMGDLNPFSGFRAPATGC